MGDKPCPCEVSCYQQRAGSSSPPELSRRAGVRQLPTAGRARPSVLGPPGCAPGSSWGCRQELGALVSAHPWHLPTLLLAWSLLPDPWCGPGPLGWSQACQPGPDNSEQTWVTRALQGPQHSVIVHSAGALGKAHAIDVQPSQDKLFLELSKG